MTLEPHGINRRDELNQWHSSLLVAYHFLFTMYSNVPYVTFIFYLYSFFFYSPRWRFVLQTEISGKYNSPLFCFLSLFFLSLLVYSCCRKTQFTVLSLKIAPRFWIGWMFYLMLHNLYHITNSNITLQSFIQQKSNSLTNSSQVWICQ